MSFNFEDFLKENKIKVEHALLHYIEGLETPSKLREAMRYSLLAGGKRLRPIFLLATVDALGGELDRGMPAACALEMIHTYSLIHDDLPALDNDDYRRGQLTSHKKFGEALAILAGDALLTYAFEVLTHPDGQLDPAQQVMMVRELAQRAGPEGMVGGQTADVLGEGEPLTADQLAYIHQHKTGDLLICAVRLGCYVAGADGRQLDTLTRYARELGLAFQIQDDILDAVGDEKKLGKQVGSDQRNEKTTYVSLMGLEKARELLNMHVQEAIKALDESGVKTQLLHGLAELMINRDH